MFKYKEPKQLSKESVRLGSTADITLPFLPFQGFANSAYGKNDISIFKKSVCSLNWILTLAEVPKQTE